MASTSSALVFEEVELAVPSPSLPGWATALLVAAIFCVASEALLVSPVLSDIAGSFHTSVKSAGLTVSAYGLALALSAPFIGLLSDRFSRRQVLVSGLGLFAFTTLACGLAPTFPLLMLSRACCGLAAGAVIPTAYAYVGDAVAYDKRARTMGYVLSGWAMAMAIGVPLGGVLGQWVGWRGAFFTLAGLAAVTALQLRRLPAVRQTRAAAAAGIFHGFQSAWRAPKVPGILLIYFLHMFGFYGIYTYLGSFIRQRLGTGSAVAGLLVVFYGLGLLVSTWNGKHFDRLGKARAFRLAEVTLSVVLAGVYLAGSWPVALAAVLALWGLANGVSLTALASIASQASESARGSVMALSSSVSYVAVSAAAAGMGLVFSAFGFAPVVAASSASMLAAAAVFTWLRTGCRTPPSTEAIANRLRPS